MPSEVTWKSVNDYIGPGGQHTSIKEPFAHYVRLGTISLGQWLLGLSASELAKIIIIITQVIEIRENKRFSLWSMAELGLRSMAEILLRAYLSSLSGSRMPIQDISSTSVH